MWLKTFKNQLWSAKSPTKLLSFHRQADLFWNKRLFISFHFWISTQSFGQPNSWHFPGIMSLDSTVLARLQELQFPYRKRAERPVTTGLEPWWWSVELFVSCFPGVGRSSITKGCEQIWICSHIIIKSCIENFSPPLPWAVHLTTLQVGLSSDIPACKIVFHMNSL